MLHDKFTNLLRPRWGLGMLQSLFSPEAVEATYRELVGDATFEELPVPFAVVAACLLLGACAQHGGYLHQAPQPSLLPSSQPTAAGNRAMYLDLIRQMQEKGAYYASLAQLDAYRQRYGNPPELRRLQADAQRETGQAAQAEAVYRGLLDTDQVAAAWHGLGLIDAAGQWILPGLPGLPFFAAMTLILLLRPQGLMGKRA